MGKGSGQAYKPAPLYGEDIEWVVQEVFRKPKDHIDSLVNNSICFIEPPD
jgi:hypothetical protein